MVKKQSVSCASRVFPGACLFMRFARCGKRQAARQVRRAPRGLARLGACAIDTVSWGLLAPVWPSGAGRVSITSPLSSLLYQWLLLGPIHRPLRVGTMRHSPGYDRVDATFTRLRALS